jgi:hypothetical protein
VLLAVDGTAPADLAEQRDALAGQLGMLGLPPTAAGAPEQVVVVPEMNDVAAGQWK